MTRPTFAGDLRGDLTGLRIAWCPDLGGLPIEPEVLGVLDGARARLTALGCDVRDVAVDLGAADEAFETLRAVAFVRAFAPILPTLRRTAKATLLWNIDQGLALDGPAVARALAARSAVFATVAELLERFDVLVAPAAQVVPFAIDLEYPAAGRRRRDARTTSDGCACARASPSRPTRSSPFRPASLTRDCRSGCNSWVATARTAACSNTPRPGRQRAG